MCVIYLADVDLLPVSYCTTCQTLYAQATLRPHCLQDFPGFLLTHPCTTTILIAVQVAVASILKRSSGVWDIHGSEKRYHKESNGTKKKKGGARASWRGGCKPVKRILVQFNTSGTSNSLMA